MRLLRNGLSRFLIFWMLTAGTIALANYCIPSFRLELIWPTIANATQNPDAISNPAFAFSLAWLLGALAAGLSISFLVCHVLSIGLSLRAARGHIEKIGGKGSEIEARRVAFAENYESIRQRLRRHSLIGHAYQEFDETLVRDERIPSIVSNTVRPQAFINIGTAREKRSGLKIMNSVPGYFVGAGLLLTFIGLVFALHKAGEAANASDAATMQAAMGDLLQIATFKFATSIAGLGASLLLSILFRLYTIWLEGCFDRFCAQLENVLLYTAPQSISAEMNATLKEQRDQLKEITQGDFFARMGEEIGPRINDAFRNALMPVTTSIDTAMGRMSESSADGMRDLVGEFSRSVQSGAGSELRELAATLSQMQVGLVEMQAGLRGTGEDFGRRMAEAAENLNRIVAEAGANLGQSSEQSRAAFADVAETLRQTMERANVQVEASLATAAGGASERLEAAMGRVLEKLEAQVSSFSGDIGRFQSDMRGEVEATSAHVASARRDAADALTAVSTELSETLKTGFGSIMTAISSEFDRLMQTMRGLEQSMVGQSNAIAATSSETRKTADVFHETAASVRQVSQPLFQVGDRFAKASDGMAENLATTLAALKAAQEASGETANALRDAHGEVKNFWQNYAESFRGIDVELAKAVTDLSQASINQSQNLSGHVREVDEGLAKAIGKLNGLLVQINDTAESISDSVERWRDNLSGQAA
ncbi:anti-phage ZorAB system protein ZorA [Jiella marina]|uniref:anti-phage ZorAB system protein ZorA n=1 Tax=Jiella sp. LLJ827 TaxID=2917712 RepID=UPI002100B3F9|nr:anti-phage ZorAB system protein ZorA [Jiella sp. LLJ827]MCQ0987168.1 anti-phage defense ZorAB system protein ZorA [Jiella sp. LLJ827]